MNQKFQNFQMNLNYQKNLSSRMIQKNLNFLMYLKTQKFQTSPQDPELRMMYVNVNRYLMIENKPELYVHLHLHFWKL